MTLSPDEALTTRIALHCYSKWLQRQITHPKDQKSLDECLEMHGKAHELLVRLSSAENIIATPWPESITA